jgi:hypothetical protein
MTLQIGWLHEGANWQSREGRDRCVSTNPIGDSNGGVATRPGARGNHFLRGPVEIASVPAAPERVRDPKRGARLRVPNRDQIERGRIDLEAQLPEDHPARAIWAVIERLELSALYTPQIYRQRVATAETVNADAKQHRGLDQFVVRGLEKVVGSATLFALTYNILRLVSLGG